MKSTAQNFRQTHFVGLLPPDELSQTIENCRAWTNEKFGCKSGHATPVHITIVPPFALSHEFSTTDVVDCAKVAVEKLIAEENFPFVAKVCGFGAFEERTIFAKVEQSEKWNRLREKITAEMQKSFPKIKRATKEYQPHLTVANRDIPNGEIGNALEYFAELNLDFSFCADNVAIFTRSKNGIWEICDKNVLYASAD